MATFYFWSEVTGVLRFDEVENRLAAGTRYEEFADKEGRVWYREHWRAFATIKVTPATPPATLEALRELGRSVGEMEVGVLWRLDEGGYPDLMQVRPPDYVEYGPLGGDPIGVEFTALGRYTCGNSPPDRVHAYRPLD